ncbi:MAG: hypothetical protein M3376_05265 [Actinomycetota bacterium]|nr:hypothetical protein [Actinomycetota bacterium]
MYPFRLSTGALNVLLVPAACRVIRAEPEARVVIGARMLMVRLRRLKVARASESFAVNLSHAAGRGGVCPGGVGRGGVWPGGFCPGGVWQYGAFPV